MIVGVLTTCHSQYTRDRSVCIFLFNRTTLQVFVAYLTDAPFDDSTSINTIIEFLPHVRDDSFNGGSDPYLQFRDTHAPCLLKLCIPPSNGIVRWWLFPEFGAELPLDICTPTIILNNAVLKNFSYTSQKTLCHHYRDFRTWINFFTEHSALRFDSYGTCKHAAWEMAQTV